MHSSFAIILKMKMKVDRFVVCCYVLLLYAVCDCGMSWSNLLTFWFVVWNEA